MHPSELPQLPDISSLPHHESFKSSSDPFSFTKAFVALGSSCAVCALDGSKFARVGWGGEFEAVDGTV